MSYKNWSITVGGKRHNFGPVEVVSWEIGGREYRTDDIDRPRTDGRVFGQDFATPGDIQLELIIRADGSTRQQRFDNAMLIREQFTNVWDADSIRGKPNTVAGLQIAGIVTVEGRPRHIDWDDSNTTFGIIRGTALFVRDFDTAYDSTGQWNQTTVGLVPPQMGGLLAPLAAPLSTAASSSRARPFEVGGISEVWPIIEIRGPIQTGAQVELTSKWSVQLNRALKYDEVAVLDTQPGKRSMTLNKKSVNLLTSTGARLSSLSIQPGINEIALRGTSIEGTASVTIKWREVRKVI